MFRTVFPYIIRSLRLYIRHQIYVIQGLWLLSSKQPQNYVIYIIIYIILRILCINDGDAIIIIIYGGIQDFILLFGFTTGGRKDLFEIY